MSEQKFYRVVERRGKALIVDLDNKPLEPGEAQKLAEMVMNTAQGKAHVYIGYRESDGLFKIGRSEHLDDRSKRLGIEYLHLIECDLYGEHSASGIESLLHSFFEADRVEGEWFTLCMADVYLLRAFCRTAQDTRPFLNEFKPVLEVVHQNMGDQKAAAVVADLLENPGHHSRLQRNAIYYYLQKASAELERSGEIGKSRYCSALLDLLIKIAQIRIDRMEAADKLAEQQKERFAALRSHRRNED